jgi:hypothetical protein
VVPTAVSTFYIFSTVDYGLLLSRVPLDGRLVDRGFRTNVDCRVSAVSAQEHASYIGAIENRQTGVSLTMVSPESRPP